MTTRPTALNETTRISSADSDHNPQGSQPDNTQTTEERLTDIRSSMRYYRPAQTFGREYGRINGYYYTEPTDPGRV